MSRKVREVADDDFQSKCLVLIDEVARTGEEIVVTKDGVAVARIVPMAGVPSLRGRGLYQGDLVSPMDEPWSGENIGEPVKLFGALAGSIRIFGDILAPIDVQWDAQK
jgi:antitoxin (DNA-binding transcriptional repressor) of toxin-antitoxin stability system